MLASDAIKLCECGCGNPAPIAQNTEKKYGAVKGKPRRFIQGHNNRSHGHSPKRRLKSRTYNSWNSMIQRCNNPKFISYKDYGERGISVCDRWSGANGFANFLDDMGERPEGLTLDRIDSDGNYEPNNCRWSDWKVQAANRRKRKKRA